MINKKKAAINESFLLENKKKQLKAAMSDQGSADEGSPPTSCPVCLESWNSSERMPKFLLCHHSICVTCAGELQRTAKKKRPKTPNGASALNLQQMMSSQESLDSVLTASEAGNLDAASWVRCPMCRTKSFIEDPYMLQTNFYLRGLPKTASVPRLVLWCDTCCAVAAPECENHRIEPVGEKMRSLQEELIRRTSSLQGHVNESLKAHESHMEVYRWLCGMLRHSHSKVLAALTHAAQYHQALQHHTDAINSLVNRGEKLQTTENPDESVNKLTSLLKELDSHQSAIINEVELPILNDTFQILRTHQGPKGFGKALVVLDANKSVSLSVFGEDDRQQAIESEEDTGNESEILNKQSTTLSRAMSLQMSRRVRNKGHPKVNSLQKMAVMKAATIDIPYAAEDLPRTKEEAHEDTAKTEVKYESSTSSEEVMPSAPALDVRNDELKDKKSNDRISRVLEEPIIALETTVLKTPPVSPGLSTLPRDGTFGRKTINMSSHRYSSQIHDEEPIDDSARHLVNNDTPIELGTNQFGDRVLGEPETFSYVHEVTVNMTRPGDVAPRSSSDISRNQRHSRGNREELTILSEDVITPRQRGRRRKKGKKRPSHPVNRRVDNGGEIHNQQRGRKKGHPRQKASTRRASTSMCRVQ